MKDEKQRNVNGKIQAGCGLAMQCERNLRAFRITTNYFQESAIMARHWTDEQKARQAELIRGWQPWRHSTGAKTPEGKARSAANRQLSLDAARRELDEALRTLVDAHDRLSRMQGKNWPF